MPLSDQSRFTVNWRHSDSGLTDGVDAITEIARKLADPPGRPVIADANLAENPDCMSDHAMPVAVPMMIRMAPESAAVSISIGNRRRHSDIPSNIQHERGRTGTLSCSVLRLNGKYHMWLSVFCMEDRGYRLEYAVSKDGVLWERSFDQEVLPPTSGGFDSVNQSYANVIEQGEELWMFYTGNGFGRTGIGLATLRKSDLRG